MFAQEDIMNGILVITSHFEGPWHVEIWNEGTAIESVLGTGITSDSLANTPLSEHMVVS